MSKKEQLHFVYTKNGNWATKKPNGKIASTVSNTKKEAIKKARTQAKKSWKYWSKNSQERW